MDSQKEEETMDDCVIETDWRDNVNTVKQYTENCEEIFKHAAEFQHISDRHLERIYMTESYIKLTSQDVRLFNAAFTALNWKQANLRKQKSTNCYVK